MPQTEKVAISLPIELMRRLERSRKKTGETRSAFIRRSLERAFEESDKKRKIQAYVEGYRKHPETIEEIAQSQAAAELLASEPW